MNNLERLFMAFIFALFVVLAIFIMIKLVEYDDFTRTHDVVYQPKFSLNEILTKELVKNSSWNCVNYSEYYNKTITEKYPLFDVRWPRHLDICNNLTLCDSHHTFIIVTGNGGECILDQSQIACVDVLKRKMNQTNQTK